MHTSDLDSWNWVLKKRMSSHAQIGPQRAEKQQIKVYVGGGWLVWGQTLRLALVQLSRDWAEAELFKYFHFCLSNSNIRRLLFSRKSNQVQLCLDNFWLSVFATIKNPRHCHCPALDLYWESMDQTFSQIFSQPWKTLKRLSFISCQNNFLFCFLRFQ